MNYAEIRPEGVTDEAREREDGLSRSDGPGTQWREGGRVPRGRTDVQTGALWAVEGNKN